MLAQTTKTWTAESIPVFADNSLVQRSKIDLIFSKGQLSGFASAV